MSIYKVNANLPRTDQISDLNDMILEVNGDVESGKFNKKELDDLYDLIPASRKFLRDISLGHTLATYTGWTHLKAETGYSIWKYSPTSYAYNANNQLYFDGKVLDNKGEALSESATTFDYVFTYDGDSGGAGYVDCTTEAGTEEGTEFELMDSADDYLYVGDAATFNGIKFELQTKGSNYTLKVEYYNGAWTEVTANTNNLVDDTSDFESDGIIQWDTLTDWATVAVNSQTKYWIRISTTTTPVAVAEAYYIIPADSVVSLLALSSAKILTEDWAWCTYGTAIYVTIRNTGNSSYEGDYYITSSSSATNLKNYFIYNHEFTIDHKDSTYGQVKTKTANYDASVGDGIILIDTSSTNVTVTLPTATESTGKTLIIKYANAGSGSPVAKVDCQSGETLDGASDYTFAAEYDCIHVTSNGTAWYITAEMT